MTVSVANVDQTSDSFGGWIAKTNQIADALSTLVVSTNSNTAVGNAAVSNAFSANQLFANTVKGGVAGTPANLAITSNTYFNPYNGNVFVIVGNSTAGSYSATLSGNAVYISPSNTIQFSTNGSVKAVLTKAGNFGIGNTAPAHTLRVEGNVSISTSLSVGANVTAAGFQYSNGASVGIVIYYANGDVAFPA